ncbi:hypothetical protein EDB81DRAFT_155768 [Dactylonectria macrodidyma]|uniref:Uncharacterized protein n=1 Tax=Dactylonectria macrodidyma TaxID=307937 RepID=A0A9P9JGF4_9HYPO|nr:hypothetical protein EDB81DRAFT_155768 [Dactylonectria macrodidyma]
MVKRVSVLRFCFLSLFSFTLVTLPRRNTLQPLASPDRLQKPRPYPQIGFCFFFCFTDRRGAVTYPFLSCHHQIPTDTLIQKIHAWKVAHQRKMVKKGDDTTG